MTVHILLFDQNIERRRILAAQLRKNIEFVIAEAHTTEMLDTEQYDVALITHMPADAFEILQVLCEQNAAISTVMLATAGSEALAIRAWRQGFCDYLAYPLDEQAIYNAVMRAVDRNIRQRINNDAQHHLMSANRELNFYLQGLDKIVKVGKAITADLLLEDILKTVAQAATDVIQANMAGIVLQDETTGEHYVRVAHCRDETHQPISIDKNLVDQVMRSGQPVIMTDELDPLNSPSNREKCVAYVPLCSNVDVIGVLSVLRHRPGGSFNDWQVTLLKLLAEFGSVALNNAEKYRRTQSERDMLNAILDGTDEPVLVVNFAGCLILCNLAAQALFKIPETYRGPAEQVIEHDDVRALLRSGLTRQIEITFDDERTYQAQMTLVERVGYVIMMQDISHLKDLDQIKTNFVASVSQDLRSPLTAIMGYVELLSRAGPVNELQQTFIDRITLSAQTISDEINDLLDLSRIESSTAEINYEHVQLPTIVDYALATVEGQVSAKQLTLDGDFADQLPPVWGNARRIKQMIRNLLENAITFTPEHGAIRITLQLHDNLLLLEIADTGIGIALEDQPHIFDKFYRAEAVRDTYDGAGLGLAIVKSILDRHHGRIWVESQLGVGSTFSVLLPVGVQHETDSKNETTALALAAP